MGISPEILAGKIPADFVLGVSTAAFQIEGAVAEDGRGPSGWDAFTARPGAIAGGHTADVACDHYHRMPEDVALMQELGVDAYRFSIAWPRIQPEGTGPANPAGLAFYDRLLDELLERGIAPMATVYHWDTPLPLELAGGWMNRDTAYRLAEFAEIVGEAYGDRITNWVTINEPTTVVLNGYGIGLHAPGRKLLFEALPAAHHLILGHGLSVQALRAAGVAGQVGITNVYSPVRPASAGVRDTLFAQAFDVLHNGMFSDPVLLGRYPDTGLLLNGYFGYFKEVTDEDLAVMSEPLDFYGLNYYMPTRIAAGAAPELAPEGLREEATELPFRMTDWPMYAKTGFGWPVAPDFLGVALKEMADRYPGMPPVYITEGGASFPDVLIEHALDGAPHVADVQRIDYISSHLNAALDATAPGGPAEALDLRGYFIWTLMDNFEWAEGYNQRFGLVHVDFDTLQRTPKASFRWLQQLIALRPRP